MSEIVDEEGTDDRHSTTPFNSKEPADAQPGPSSLPISLTDAATEDTVPVINIDEALGSVPDPKQNEPPKILPGLNFSHGDILVKEKDRERELQGNVFSASTLEASVRQEEKCKCVSLILIRLEHLLNTVSVQHQPKGIEYTQKIKDVIKKPRLHKILAEEKDAVFLQQLLEDILDTQISNLDGTSPDPVLAAMAASPSCHRRENAELPAPIPYDAED